MEKVRICFTVPSIQTYSETFIRNLRNILEGDIHYCYGGFIPLQSEDCELKDHSKASFILRGLEKFGYLNMPLAEKYFGRYLKKKRIQLIIANYGQSGAEITRVARELSIPLIVHFHGYDASIYEILEKYKMKYLEMFAYAKAVIVVSEEMKRTIINLGCDTHKIFLIRCSPSHIYQKVKPNYLSNQVIAIGRFVEKKAPYLTLLAIKKVEDLRPHIKFKFVGDGQLLDICKDISLALKLKNVEFLGVLSPEEIAEEMSASFCFVQHSKTASNGNKEGSPVAILEAMSSGLPIVSTYHAGIPDVVKSGENGYLIEEGDVDSMAEAIVRLYDNRDEVERIGLNNKNFIVENLSTVKYKSEWNSLINEIMKTS